MTSGRHAAVPGLVLLAVAACSGRDSGSKIALRFHPPTGAVYHYALEQRTEITMQSGPLTSMGKQQLLMRMYFTQTVKGTAAGGGTEVDVVFDSTTLDLPGTPSNAIAGELAKLRGLRSTVVFDERAQILRTDFAPGPEMSPQLVNQMGAGIKAMTFAFPEQPLGRGESWTLTTDLPLSQLPGTDASDAGPARTTLTLRELHTEASDTSVTLDIKTEFPSGPIHLAIGGQTGTLTMSGNLTGRQIFSMTRGAVLDATIQGRMTMNVESPMLGKMVMLSDLQNTLHLGDGK